MKRIISVIYFVSFTMLWFSWDWNYSVFQSHSCVLSVSYLLLQYWIFAIKKSFVLHLITCWPMHRLVDLGTNEWFNLNKRTETSELILIMIKNCDKIWINLKTSFFSNSQFPAISAQVYDGKNWSHSVFICKLYDSILLNYLYSDMCFTPCNLKFFLNYNQFYQRNMVQSTSILFEHDLGSGAYLFSSSLILLLFDLSFSAAGISLKSIVFVTMEF